MTAITKGLDGAIVSSPDRKMMANIIAAEALAGKFERQSMFHRAKRLWKSPAQLKSSYDAVIIGAGLHGLATAYYLAKEHGIKDVAILEKRYIGFGGAGRNTAIVRANQRTQENVLLCKEALDLWPVLTKELDFNLMFNNCGNLNLLHSEAAMNSA